MDERVRGRSCSKHASKSAPLQMRDSLQGRRTHRPAKPKQQTEPHTLTRTQYSVATPHTRTVCTPRCRSQPARSAGGWHGRGGGAVVCVEWRSVGCAAAPTGQVTAGSLPPPQLLWRASMFKMSAPQPTCAPGVRHVIKGGERLQPRLPPLEHAVLHVPPVKALCVRRAGERNTAFLNNKASI